MNARWDHVTFISAGAGSGKTYRLTEELERALRSGEATPAGVIGTTFTVKAAAELRERVRDKLLANGHLALAERMGAESLIGTVHSVCERLLRRFAFEIGISPQLGVMSVDDGARFFNHAIDAVLAIDRVRDMNAFARRLGMVDKGMPTWQRTVKDIADKARENNIDATALREMGGRNAIDLLGFFGEPLDRDPTGELRERVADAIDNLPTDGTVATAKYQQRLMEAAADLARRDCPWYTWMGLAGSAGAKAAEQWAGRVRETAVLYERHPAFQRDLDGFTRGLFDIAAASLTRFDALKREHGLIDFADMERHMLFALDLPPVRERLREEVQLLLVDEFQDTNPMQLALFLKLAALAKRVVFVGDVKQAIYEFRGCDPTLVFQTLDGLTAGNARKDILDQSWRAQPALLNYLNELFAAVFEGEVRRKEVVLSPKRDPLGVPAVTSWRLTAKGSGAALAAAGVARLVAEGETVVDRDTGQTRPVSWGDVAVLARTNKHVEEIATALRAANVPMKMTLAGLLQTPEVWLARACLRRVADRADTLATAEILALADCADAEQWLNNRLDWLAGDGDDIAWREDDHPVIKRLGELRDESALRSPVEVVARVLNEVDLRRIVAAWGPDDVRAAQRQKNLDAFLNLAVEYEKHAASHHGPGTLTGFLFWLEHPSSPDLDLQPVVTTGDAVHVLTYHRAKGLEWPVVICTDFDYEERLPTWDVRVELTRRFDLNAPLANRVLRYWPKVFGPRKIGVPARAAIEDSEEGRRCRERSLAEQRRLAYVGMTRARDRLVIAVTGKTREDSWLNSFGQPFAIPDQATLTLPHGPTIATRAETIDAAAAERAPRPYAPRWFGPRTPGASAQVPAPFIRAGDQSDDRCHRSVRRAHSPARRRDGRRRRRPARRHRHGSGESTARSRRHRPGAANPARPRRPRPPGRRRRRARGAALSRLLGGSIRRLAA